MASWSTKQNISTLLKCYYLISLIIMVHLLLHRVPMISYQDYWSNLPCLSCIIATASLVPTNWTLKCHILFLRMAFRSLSALVEGTSTYTRMACNLYCSPHPLYMAAVDPFFPNSHLAIKRHFSCSSNTSMVSVWTLCRQQLNTNKNDMEINFIEK